MRMLGIDNGEGAGIMRSTATYNVYFKCPKLTLRHQLLDCLRLYREGILQEYVMSEEQTPWRYGEINQVVGSNAASLLLDESQFAELPLILFIHHGNIWGWTKMAPSVPALYKKLRQASLQAFVLDSSKNNFEQTKPAFFPTLETYFDKPDFNLFFSSFSVFYIPPKQAGRRGVPQLIVY